MLCHHPEHCLLSAEHHKADMTCGLGLPPRAAFRDSVVSKVYPIPLPLSKPLLGRPKAHPPGSSASHLAALAAAMQGRGPRGWRGSPWQRGEGGSRREGDAFPSLPVYRRGGVGGSLPAGVLQEPSSWHHTMSLGGKGSARCTAPIALC